MLQHSDSLTGRAAEAPPAQHGLSLRQRLGRLYERLLAGGEVAPSPGAVQPSAGSTMPVWPAALAADSPLLDSCRSLRVSLSGSQLGRGLPPLVLAACAAGEATALTAAGLATVLASEGHPTLLVDGSLREPCLDRLFGLTGRAGLGELMTGPLPEQIGVLVTDYLTVLPAGRWPDDPTRLFSSSVVADRLADLRARFETLIAYTVADWTRPETLLIARQVGAVLLVVRAGTDSAVAVRQLKTTFERANVRLLGFALVE